MATVAHARGRLWLVAERFGKRACFFAALSRCAGLYSCCNVTGTSRSRVVVWLVALSLRNSGVICVLLWTNSYFSSRAAGGGEVGFGAQCVLALLAVQGTMPTSVFISRHWQGGFH